jgi:hypothetical protein
MAASTSKGSKAKAAGIVAAGGGPEDPVTDAVALGALVKPKKAKTQAPSGAGRIGGKSKLLLTEFLVCFVILGAGTVVAPQGSKDGIPRLMTRGTGLCILFFILSLVSGGGPKAKKGAEALGGLVTVSYLVLSSDALNIFKWVGSFFGGSAYQAGSDFATATNALQGQQAAESAGAAAGAGGDALAQELSGSAGE